jgi:hypothetical protein
MATTNYDAPASSEPSMQLLILCLVAWLVLVVAALASGGVGSAGGQNKAGTVIAN